MADLEPDRIAESVCPAGPDGVHYFFSDDECAYCHKLDQIAEYVRTFDQLDRCPVCRAHTIDGYEPVNITVIGGREQLIAGGRHVCPGSTHSDGSGGAGTMEP